MILNFDINCSRDFSICDGILALNLLENSVACVKMFYLETSIGVNTS
jgi:hypothetical protein